MPTGGPRTSLAGMVAMLSKPFRNKPTETQDDLNQFKDVFLPDSGNFSPGLPLAPPQREPVRAWNYPFSWNTIYTPRSYENISFEELRALAENYDVVRLAIETRKDQIEKLNWQITPKDTDIVAADGPDRAQKVQDFFEYPDGLQPFASWLRELLEDLLVIDAPALEVRRNRANEIIGLDVIDGSTIKILLDYNGRTPRPPAPAFEQIIHGRPWALVQDGQRTNNENPDDPVLFTDSELIYAPRNRRAHKAYGFSPVEQIIVTVNIGLRRQISQLNEFTEGNMPPGLVTAPSGWNPDQIQQMQDWWDTMLAGNLQNKRKLMWGPDGAKYQRFFEAPIKDDFDEWLARIVCFAFSLPPTPFTKMQNRGEQEASKEASLEEGLAPLMGWVKRLVDSIIQRRMGHKDLEFVWSAERPVDPATQAKIIDIKLHSGRMTLNEARDEDGLDPVDGGDHVMFFTPSGPLLLSAVVGGTGYPRDMIDTPPNDPANRDTTIDEQQGAIPDEGTLAPEPPHPGRPGDSANPRKDPNAGDNTDTGPGKKNARGTLSQAMAAYQDHPRDDERCADCTMFRPPDTCSLVHGEIAEDGWCRYFEEVRAAKASRPFARRARLGAAPGRNAALLTRTEEHLKQKLNSFFADRAKHVAAQIAKDLG